MDCVGDFGTRWVLGFFEFIGDFGHGVDMVCLRGVMFRNLLRILDILGPKKVYHCFGSVGDGGHAGSREGLVFRFGLLRFDILGLGRVFSFVQGQSSKTDHFES